MSRFFRPSKSRSDRRSPRLDARKAELARGAVIEGLEPRQMFAADLGVRFDTDTLTVPQFIVPGGGFNAPIIVKNNGPMAAVGLVTVQYYASTNASFDASDILLGSYNNLPISLSGSGVNSEGDFSDAAVIPRDMAPGNYFLLVRIVPNSQVNDTNQSNNIAISDTTMNVSWRFGTVGNNQNVPLKLRDADSNVDFTWSGPGTGTVTKNPDGSFSISIENSGAGSSFTMGVSGGDAQATVKNISVAGSFGNITIPGVNISGNVTIGGTLARLEARNFIGVPNVGASVTVNGTGVDTVFKFGLVANASITTSSGIAELTLSSKWSDNDSQTDLITAPYISALNVTGNFAAGLRLSASSGPSGSPVLGNTNITGQAGTNSWWVNGRAGTIKVGSTNVYFSASFAGAVDSFQTTVADMRGDLAAPRFNSVSIAKTINTGRILAGANLGRDGRLGGAGLNADSFSFGQLLSLYVGNKILRGIIGVGLDPVNGVFDDGDDFIRGGAGSKLGPVTVVSATTPTTRFLAGKYTGAVSINGAAINPKNDRRFVLTESVAPTAVVVGSIPTTGPATISIKFTDNGLLNIATIGNMDVKITGPAGFESFLTLSTALPPENSNTYTATFNVAAPGGAWDPADAGMYQIVLLDNAVRDMVGNFVPGGTLGTFTISFV